MKKRIVMFLAAAMAAIGAWADEETVGGYTWTYRINGDTAEILGDMAQESPAISPKPTGAITIPSTLGGKPVTGIGDLALYGCENVTSVTIPDSVTSIGIGAFYGCIGLTSATIPGGVTNIGDWAFYYCRGLTSVTIPDNATSIGIGAFYGCSGLASVTIPDSVTNIGDSAFFDCSGLASVTIGNGVTSIDNEMFYGCSGLTSVTIPDSVTSIDGGAFCYCSSLTNVTIPASVTNIGDGAFYGCPDMLFDVASIPGLKLIDGWVIGVTIPSDIIGCLDLTGVCGIGGGAFSGCSGLTSVTIPDGIASIGDSAFSNCSGLTSVTIPASVTSIGDSAFAGCSGLTSVTISDGVTSIGKEAFYCCSGLTSVTIPAGVTNIGDGAFSGCDRLQTVSVASGNSMYKTVSGLLLTKDGKTLVAVPGTFTSVTIPASVTNIGNWAFGWNSGLVNVVIPRGVTRIGDRAFLHCRGLTSVTIPDGVTSIGEWAFYGCESLTGISIPNSVTSIGERAFGWCTGLVDEDGFVVIKGTLYCYYPLTSRPDVIIPDGVTSIDECVFDNHNWLTSVTMPGSVTNIGSHAFAYCSGLMSVTISDGVMTIGDCAFMGCSALASVTIPASVTTIGEYAFSYCNELASVTFMGDAPTFASGGWLCFYGVAAECTAYVRKGSTGWGVKIPGTWNGIRIEYLADDPDPSYKMYGSLSGSAPMAAASEYNGYLVDAKGNVKGTVQVKVGKPNAKTKLAAVKATVVLGAKKLSLKAADKGKAEIADGGPTVVSLVGNGAEACEVTLGAEGLSGTYGAYFIDGARNFFTSKDKAEVNVANAVLGKWLGAVNVVWNGGSVNVSIANKGKAKVKGTLADGKTKVSANSVFLVGEEWCCVPVVAPKANLAFNLWLSSDGRSVVAEGLGDGVLVGAAGSLPANAKFRVPKDAALWTQLPGSVLAEYLPDGVAVTQSGTRWTLPKAGKVALKNGVLDDSKAGENPSGLKLTYKAKDGSFKGSFKVYAEQSGKLKTTTVNVTGVMVGGKGYGTATAKGVGSVDVTIE